MSEENEIYVDLVNQIKLRDEEIKHLKQRLTKKTRHNFWKKQAIRVYENIFLFFSIVFIMLEICGIFIARLDYQYDSWFDRHWLFMLGTGIFFIVVPYIVNFITNTKENDYERRKNKENRRILNGKK